MHDSRDTRAAGEGGRGDMLKERGWRAGSMVKSLSENPGLVVTTHVVAHNHHNPNSRGPTPLLTSAGSCT